MSCLIFSAHIFVSILLALHAKEEQCLVVRFIVHFLKPAYRSEAAKSWACVNGLHLARGLQPPVPSLAHLHAGYIPMSFSLRSLGRVLDQEHVFSIDS